MKNHSTLPILLALTTIVVANENTPTPPPPNPANPVNYIDWLNQTFGRGISPDAYHIYQQAAKQYVRPDTPESELLNGIDQHHQTQCKKCRVPVITSATPRSSHAATVSSSRFDPPG